MGNYGAATRNRMENEQSGGVAGGPPSSPSPNQGGFSGPLGPVLAQGAGSNGYASPPNANMAPPGIGVGNLERANAPSPIGGINSLPLPPQSASRPAMPNGEVMDRGMPPPMPAPAPISNGPLSPVLNERMQASAPPEVIAPPTPPPAPRPMPAPTPSSGFGQANRATPSPRPGIGGPQVGAARRPPSGAKARPGRFGGGYGGMA